MHETEGTGMVAQASDEAAERRREERYSVAWEAEILILERTAMFRGQVVNVSPSGCYVRTAAWVRVPPGTVVELVFAMEGRMIRTRAEARFAQSRTGVGLRFQGLDQEVRQRLDGVLDRLRAAAAKAAAKQTEEATGKDEEEVAEAADGENSA